MPDLLLLLPGIVILLAGGCFMLRYARRRRKEPLKERRRRKESPFDYPHPVFVKIMEAVAPMDRGDKYEDPLDEWLELKGLGMVTGGGTQLSKDGVIEWVGIDVRLANLDTAVEGTRARLRELGAPPGSVLEFQADGKPMTLAIA